MPKRMETVDDEIRDNALKFLDKAKADNKPFSCGSIRHACTLLRTCRKISGDAQLQKRLVDTKPEWRNSTTMSAW